MARTKDFVRDVALSRAIAVFSQHGFEGTSTEALLGAMDIRRQSLYDTFGDKWQLYLEALQRYSSDSIGAQLVVLEGAATGEAGLEALLMHAVARAR
jgi:TetR/AcrR family transcriptional repressor of nem operon